MHQAGFSPAPSGSMHGGPTSCAQASMAASALSPGGNMQSPFGNMGYYNNNPTSPSDTDENSLPGNTTPTHHHDFGGMSAVATTTSGGGGTR